MSPHDLLTIYGLKWVRSCLTWQLPYNLCHEWTQCLIIAVAYAAHMQGRTNRLVNQPTFRDVDCSTTQITHSSWHITKLLNAQQGPNWVCHKMLMDLSIPQWCSTLPTDPCPHTASNDTRRSRLTLYCVLLYLYCESLSNKWPSPLSAGEPYEWQSHGPLKFFMSPCNNYKKHEG
jgi:hypothetical protein